MAPTLPQALENLIRGESIQDSFRVVFNTYQPRVARFLERKGLSSPEASEAAQEVFLSAYRHIDQLRDPDRFEAWLFSIARNRAAQHFEYRMADKRSAASVVDLSEGHGLASIADRRPGPLEDLLGREQVVLLRSALEDLPPQMRRCVVARIVDQYSVQDVAQSLGISVNTVKVHLHRAKLLLTDRLKGKLGREVPLDD